jgi:hypothetical protein
MANIALGLTHTTFRLRLFFWGDNGWGVNELCVVKNMHIHIPIPSADFLGIVLHANLKTPNAEALPA